MSLSRKQGQEWERRRCVRKRPYGSRKAALAAIDGKPRDRDWGRLRAFGCDQCGQWHIGRAPVAVDRSAYRSFVGRVQSGGTS